MPPDSYVDWGAVHFYTPLNRTGEQILTDEEKVTGLLKLVQHDCVYTFVVTTIHDRSILPIGERCQIECTSEGTANSR